MKKIISILLILSEAGLVGYSQSLPNKCEAFCPQVLNKSTIYLSDIEKLSANNYGQRGTSTNKYWDVYSDRCDNEVYKGSSISSGTTGKKLSFNQKLRIAKIENGFALVYIENKPGGVNYPQLSSDCNPVGWVPMDNLLLWTSCPTNDVGIYRKALIVRNIDQKRDQSFGHISYHPDVNNTSHVIEIKQSIDFHYIMKEVNGRCLLAKYNKLSGTTDQILEGWVSKESILLGNYRVFLEPNWNPEVAKKLKGTFAYVYYDDKIAAAIPMGRINTITKDSSTKYRLEPDVMRFSLLEDKNDKNNQYQVLAFISTGMADIPHTKVRSFFTNGSEIEFPRERTLTAVHGYVDKKESKMGLDYWNVVLLLSSEELVELIKKLEPLKNAVKVKTYGTQERADYVKAVAGIIQSMTERSADDIEQLSTEEITRIIGGLNASTPMLKGKQSEKTYTLSDIKNPQACPDKDFMKILKRMESKIEDLSQLPKGTNFKYSFTQNGVKSYWVPLEMIP